jgi:exonuclease SbcD
LLTGNHDMPNAVARATSLDIFGTLPLANLVVASRPGVYHLQTKSGPVQIVAIPWISRSVLLSKDDLKNKTVDEIDAELLHRLESAMAQFVAELEDGVPAVLAVHGSIAGAVFGSERSTLLGHDLLIPKSLIANERFDYVALGHIHKHQTVLRRPLAVYPGSIERVDFGEESDPKGFMVVDLQGAATTARFVDLGARRFVTLSVDAYGEQPTEEVLAALEGHDLRGSIVRLGVHLSTANEGAFQDRRVRSALEGVSYLTIARHVDRGERRRGGGIAVALTPLEALRAWLTERETSPERAATLLDYGARLIAEVDGSG